ncbi:RDD family protein [Hymenobacter cheonanensis]|uniref:RDD family protein n=1 Tax=Hymenobacter sp. CA2-7 TaxID=3063993 RepID=UPI00271441B4|nr:RDD family protein [Hymenobacter sp. CA2-7]MDO7885461.1 RDD family protein [Hymenobacter sp. CA2-7]
MASIRIHTTQNVTLQYEVASVGDRLAAALLDYLVLLAYGVLLTVLVRAAGDGDSHAINYSDPAELVGVALAALMLSPFIFYFLACEIFFNGQTLGKKARHLRVMRLNGTPPRLGDYFLRWLLRPIEIIATAGGLAAVVVLLNGRGQRLGDLLAGTTVLSLRPRTTPRAPEDTVPAGYQPVFEQAAQLSDHDVALLRQLLRHSQRRQDHVLLHETALKTKQLLGISSDLPNEAFLQTVLRDHASLVAPAG